MEHEPGPVEYVRARLRIAKFTTYQRGNPADYPAAVLPGEVDGGAATPPTTQPATQPATRPAPTVQPTK